MAHTFVNKSQTNLDTSNPISIPHTPGSAATGIIVSVVSSAGEIQAGGAPTIGGVEATDSGEGLIAASETRTQVWYRLGSFDGSEVAISVPNTNSDQMNVEVVSFNADSGTSEFDDSGEDNAGVGVNTADPTVTTTVIDDFIYARMGNGEADIASVTEAQIETFANDHGNWSSYGQYMIKADTGVQSMNWTFSADDFTSIAVAFKEVAAGGISIPVVMNHLRNQRIA